MKPRVNMDPNTPIILQKFIKCNNTIINEDVYQWKYYTVHMKI